MGTFIDGILNLAGLGLGEKDSVERQAAGYVVALLALAALPTFLGHMTGVDLTSLPFVAGIVAAGFEARDHEGGALYGRWGGIVVGLVAAGLLMGLA